MRKNKYVIYSIFLLLICSCAHKSGHSGHYYQRESTSSSGINDSYPERKVRGHAKVHMTKEGGVYLVPIKVNGLDLRFIFDTGASSISL